MIILHITKGFHPDKGGIENYTYDITKSLSGKHKVYVIATHSDNKGQEKIGKINVIRLKKFFDFFHAPINLPAFGLINKIKPDIIHFHIPNPLHEIYLLIYLLIRGKKFKLIATYHADIPSYSLIHVIIEFLRKFYLIPFLKFFDFIICTSKDYSVYSPILKFFKKKIKIINLGCDKNLKTISPIKLKKKYNIKDEKIVLFVGRLFPYKGVEYLIKAIPLVTQNISKIKFVIVGSGEKEKELKELANKLRVSDKIIFTGQVEDRIRNTFYKICDVFVLPSINRGEAFGISLIEAMSFGKPLISTRIKGSGVNFVNKHLVTGLVVEPKNFNELANAILKLLKDKRLRLKLGRNAKKRFLTYFTKERMLFSTSKIYQQLTTNILKSK
ncbi:MAG: glycosyltransferase [Candidatus Aenigmatarchaeota archaeon]